MFSSRSRCWKRPPLPSCLWKNSSLPGNSSLAPSCLSWTCCLHRSPSRIRYSENYIYSLSFVLCQYCGIEVMGCLLQHHHNGNGTMVVLFTGRWKVWGSGKCTQCHALLMRCDGVRIESQQRQCPGTCCSVAPFYPSLLVFSLVSSFPASFLASLKSLLFL